MRLEGRQVYTIKCEYKRIENGVTRNSIDIHNLAFCMESPTK